MTLEETYYISQVVASVAVIASLVYLALQTRQAARSTRAAMHENRAATVLRHIDKVTEADFHPIWLKGLSASPDMTDAEIGKFSLQAAGWVVMWEERFRERKEGMLDENRWASSEATISRMMRSPGFRAVVTSLRARLDPDFGALMDKHANLGRAAPAVSAAAAWREAAAKELAAMEQPTTGPAQP